MKLFHIMPESGERLLPDPLKEIGEGTITSSEEWIRSRRDRVLRLFEENVFGVAPNMPREKVSFDVEKKEGMMGGAAVRKKVRIWLEGPEGRGVIHMLLFVPTRAAERPVPTFLLINNRGSEHMDPTRGKQSSFWPAESIVARGFAAAVFDYTDADPDYHDGFRNGVHGLFESFGSERPKEAWGSVAAWAWAASRGMDGENWGDYRANKR
ncbi:hypothetical protein ASG89_16280 [Paenibacillus sp. Soil766]|uniref:hypothetical protein n=1 Tax=Paenibacillus sp. Soil766 TaxID=1736404 RepID=UPI00070F70CF|nr:hypothetical protein [Paenibacillus sp. Soil766]KRF07995.1 hypothetical protein ASG89_16280 [Paenibacillus sp. Soil766]